MATVKRVVFPSDLGWMSLAWIDRYLLELTFGHRSPAAAARGLVRSDAAFAEADGWVAALMGRLQAFARGEVEDDFRDVRLNLSGRTTFCRAIIRHCRLIPAGQTRTYGELAARAGFPGAARAVGQVMATNRIPLVVPCHRVVAARGRLGGYSAPGGLVLKRRLLALEATLARRLVSRERR